MAKATREPRVVRPGRVVPPAAGEAKPGEPSTPQAIAEQFKAEVAGMEGVTTEAAARVPPGTAPEAPPPAWTAKGIGRAGVVVVNALLASQDFDLLEKEEEDGVAEDVAYYLSCRWPSGAAWEPELRLVGRAVEVFGPRYLARVQAAKAKALDDEAGSLANQGARE